MVCLCSGIFALAAVLGAGIAIGIAAMHRVPIILSGGIAIMAAGIVGVVLTVLFFALGGLLAEASAEGVMIGFVIVGALVGAVGALIGIVIGLFLRSN
jgi:hypothetical protein